MENHGSGGGEEMSPTTSRLPEQQRASSGSLVKRTLSFKLRRKSDDEEPIDPKQIAAMRWRYKDISKQVIWVECPLTVAHLDKGYLEIRPPSYDVNQLGHLSIDRKGSDSTLRPELQGTSSSAFTSSSKSALVKSTLPDVVEPRRKLEDIPHESDEEEPDVQITRL